MQVEKIRDQLRSGRSPSLRRRRGIAALSIVGLVDFAVLSLYQLGIVPKLPDPPGKIFDSGKVNASKTAFATGVPDATLGALLQASMLVLASAMGSKQTGRGKLWDVALAAAALGAAGSSAYYTVDMIKREKRLCPYCLLAAGLSFAALPLALKEASAALSAEA